MTNQAESHLQAVKQGAERQQREAQGMQIAVLEQMWLELARALAEQGALNGEALAQRLEVHALRAQEHAGWYYGLMQAARLLRQSSNDPDSLVQ